MSVKQFLGWCLVSAGLLPARLLAQPVPENLAAGASITASSEHSQTYLAKYVADGRIASYGTRDSDGTEWAANGSSHPDGVTLTFTWPEPQTISEIVYYGRSSYMVECFKDFEVMAGAATAPVHTGTLQSGHGGQRIKLPAALRTSSLTIKFLNAYHSLNPGAAEVQIYASSPENSAVGRFIPALADGTLDLSVNDSKELAAELKAGKFGFNKLVVAKRHELSPTHVYTYHAESFKGGGGLYVYDLATGEQKEIVASPNGEIIDVDVSYDGKEILFSWKKEGRSQDIYDPVQDFDAEGTFQVCRINADGSGLKQLTSGRCNNFNACWLPDGRIAFLSDRKNAFAYCFTTTSPILHCMNRDGDDIVRISSSYLNDFTPAVLNDGRIVYSRWEYIDRPAIPIQALWAINPDGTGVAGLFGNRVISPGTFMEAHSMPGSTDDIICVLTSHNGPCRGAIGLIDTSYDANAQSAIRNLTPEVNIGKVDSGNGNDVWGPYESPWPVDKDHFLVSKNGTLLLRDLDGTRQVTVLQKKDLGFYHARPLAARKRPPVITSSLPKKTDQEWAEILLQDVYAGLEPDVKRGDIKQICVVHEIEKSQRIALCNEVPTGKGYASNCAFGFQFPLVSCGATYAGKRVVGFAAVEKDGSAHFKVPSGIPLYFLALDAEGRTVQRMRTFTHFMPGERQSCVGCHADRNYVSPFLNRRPVAASKPAADLTDPEWGKENFAYFKVVQPVLDKNCVSCHNAKEHPKGVDLTGDKTDFFNVSYDVLCRTGTQWAWQPQLHGGSQEEPPYIRWISTVNGAETNIRQIKPRTWGSPASKLTKLVLSGHPDADGKPRVALSDQERNRLLIWMDLNIPYYGEVKSNYTRRMGCRRMLPPELAPVLAEVAGRRCAACHENGKIPQTFYTRMLQPENNSFLMAPLAKASGGSEACGRAVFADKDDPDYQKILKLFEPIQKMLSEKPRMDMPGAMDAWTLENKCPLVAQSAVESGM